MKLKSKLILGATSLLVLSGVAAGTSTFAWYTANRSVSLGITTIQATTDVSALSISYYDSSADTGDSNAFNDRNEVGEADPATAVSGVDSTIEFTNKLTDVTGHGVEGAGTSTFIKPIMGAADSSEITNMVGEWGGEDVYQTSHPGISYFHEFTFTYSVTGTQEVALYLSAKNTDTFVSEVNGDGTYVENSVRIASFVDELDSGDHSGQNYYINPNSNSSTTNEDNTYLTYDDPTFTSNSVTDNILDESDEGFFQNDRKFTEADMYTGAGEPTGDEVKYDSATTGYIATLDPAAQGGTDSVNVTFKTWIEGTDVDTIANSADLAAAFELKLGFYTLTLSTMQVHN